MLKWDLFYKIYSIASSLGILKYTCLMKKKNPSEWNLTANISLLGWESHLRWWHSWVQLCCFCAQPPQQGEAAEIHVNLSLLRADCEGDVTCICFVHTDGERLHLWEEFKGVNGMHVRLMKLGFTCDDIQKGHSHGYGVIWYYLT